MEEKMQNDLDSGDIKEAVERDNQQSKDVHDEREDHFSRFMFGPHLGKQQKDAHLHPHGHQPEQPNIDVDQLMMNIDTLMESFQNLKPLFQKVYPFIGQFWKKK